MPLSKGLDSNISLAHVAEALAKDGYTFVARYIDPSKDEPLTVEEVKILHEAKLAIVSLWEEGSPTNAAFFTHARGVDHGRTAYARAKALGQPLSAPIYFTVDYDASRSEISRCILPYFMGVREGLKEAAEGGPTYFVGAYGSGDVCALLANTGETHFSWLAQSRGWGGAVTFTAWDLRQGPETSVRGRDIDADSSRGHGGGW